MDYDRLYGATTAPPVKSEKPVEVVPLPELPDNTDIRERAKAVEHDIFKTYYTLMMAESTPPAIKKSCADALADRARGKPAQSTEITGKITHETLIIMRSPTPVTAIIDAEVKEIE